RVVRLQDASSVVRSVPNFDDVGLGINQPDFFNAGLEVLFQLPDDQGRGFTGRYHFDSDLGNDVDHLGVPEFRAPIAEDDTKVRCASNCGRQLVQILGKQYLSDPLFPEIQSKRHQQVLQDLVVPIGRLGHLD